MFVKPLIIYLIMLILSVQCAPAKKIVPSENGKRPKWIDNPSQLYNDKEYLVTVGSGNTGRDAENNALGNLAKIFKVDVNVEQSVLDQYLEEESGGKISSSSSSLLLGKTSASSAQQLKNIKIARSHFIASEAVYYALAVLDRRETAAIYQKEILDNQQKIKDYYQHYSESDNKLQRLSFLYKTINLSDINNLLNEQYRIIAMSDGWAPVITEVQLDADLSEALANVSVSIESESQNNSEINSFIMEAIGKIGFLSGSESTDFTCIYSFSYEKTNINRENMVALNWHIDISFRDNSASTVLFVFNKEKRTVAVSAGELNSKMMRTVHNEINTNFYKKIIKNLNSM